MPNYPSLHPSDADFVAIRRRHAFYVDKTNSLSQLLETDEVPHGDRPELTQRHQLLVRPRRFGKTMLINTLEAWFQGLPPAQARPLSGRARPAGRARGLVPARLAVGRAG